jgi:DNA-binding NarL/FixJ family response regulator
VGRSNGSNGGAIALIVVRDDTLLFSEVLCEALKREAGVRLLSRPLLLGEAIDFCGAKQPDVILVEATNASPRSLRNLVRPIRAACEAPVVLVADEKMDDTFLVAGVEAGACGIVDSSGGMGQVLHAVRAAAAGERLVDSSRLLDAIERAARLREGERKRAELLGLLSAREREILAELDRGLGNSEIAERLRISPRTVEKHVHNILAKLQVPSRLAAVALAKRMSDSAYEPMRGTA